MNQARTTYQSDYTPFDWLENNLTSDVNEFCCPENIDECLKYISQEFCALGYPSIYSDARDCPFAVNCDIVKLLNATFELLRNCSEQTLVKEDLENRNQRLSSDLSVLTKKNSQLKDTQVQNERKLASAIERERQLKVKNEQLSNSLKAEKDETKRLIAQIRQQKVFFQHEIRKYENSINQIKTKINQLLSDKNPNKKIASMNISHTLPRNSGQRGKWKTSTAATSAVGDMYNSVIASYETRCQNLYKELNSHQLCLQSVLMQLLETISSFQEDADQTDNITISEEFILNIMKNANEDIKSCEDKFKYVFSILKKFASKETRSKNKNLQDEVAFLKSKIADYEKKLAKYEEPLQVTESQKCITNVEKAEENSVNLPNEKYLESEKLKLAEEKQALVKLLENIEKEKAELSVQKLTVLRLAMQQKVSNPVWHQGLSTLPSVSVITFRDGSTRIPNINQLKFNTSSPDQVGQSVSPLWKLNVKAEDKVCHSKSDSVLLNENRFINETTVCSPQSEILKFANSDLPSWAVTTSEAQNIVTEDGQNSASETTQNLSAEDLDIVSEPSSEEINLLRLRTAIQDIEQRRSNIS